MRQGHATLAATQEELKEGQAGQEAPIRDMQQQMQDLRLGASRGSAEHTVSSMVGVPAARADMVQGGEKNQDNDSEGGSKKRPSSEELDAGRTKAYWAQLMSQYQGSVGFGGGGSGGGPSR